MIVAVGERGNWPITQVQAVQEWASVWLARPLACVLTCPAFPSREQRARFAASTGLRPDKWVNLLPPDTKPGTWDREDARVAALALLRHAAARGWRLALLGRRVAEAVSPLVRLEFARECTVMSPCGDPVSCLPLPHPGGRSRVLNSEDARERCREAVETWCAR